MQNKALFVCLTSALQDNTFLVGQRGNIQMGSPQLFFRYLSNKISFKRQAVCVCVSCEEKGGGGDSNFKQTLSTDLICHVNLMFYALGKSSTAVCCLKKVLCLLFERIISGTVFLQNHLTIIAPQRSDLSEC